jgi:uncharacterized phage protein (TIGR02218 family)
MLAITSPLAQFYTTNVVRLSTAWKLTRTDGFILRLTSHDHIVTLNDGEEYTPVSAVNDSAKERNLNQTTIDNIEAKVALNSSFITMDDLRAGLWRNAQIDQYVFNFSYPWIGNIITETFFIKDIAFTGEIAEFKLEGMGYRFNARQGHSYTQMCPFELGDADCKFVLTSESASVTAIINQRREFTSSGLAGTQSDDFYKYGKVSFTSGANSGLIVDVAEYADVSGTVKLRFPAPFDFAMSDGFDIFRGCDKTQGTCVTKFSNVANFGGFPYLPGINETIRPFR